MDIQGIIRSLEKTKRALEQHVASDVIIDVFEKACEEFDRQLEAFRLFVGNREIGLDEDWTHAHLVGFIICGKAYRWSHRGKAIRVYIGLARILREMDKGLFAKLPDLNDFTSKNGNVYITRNPSRLREPDQLANEVFFETNLNNELKRTNIISLLRVYDIEHTDVHFYSHN
jgi:hypothetical protein